MAKIFCGSEQSAKSMFRSRSWADFCDFYRVQASKHAIWNIEIIENAGREVVLGACQTDRFNMSSVRSTKSVVRRKGMFGANKVFKMAGDKSTPRSVDLSPAFQNMGEKSQGRTTRGSRIPCMHV